MPIRDYREAVAVVTGAANGLGAALARGLAERGARVALVDLDPSVITAAGQLGGARGYVVDVSDRVAVEGLAKTVAADFGGLNLLINNAGVALAGALEAVDHDDMHWLMNVNFWGVVHGCRAFLPLLRAGSQAQLVNVVSAFAWLGMPGKSAYGASKAAVRALSEALRVELHGTGVGVTLLVPGPLDTGIVQRGRTTSEAQREAEARFVARRAIALDRVVVRTLRGISRDQARVVVGSDAWMLDLAARFAPSLTLAVLARIARRLPF